MWHWDYNLKIMWQLFLNRKTPVGFTQLYIKASSILGGSSCVICFKWCSISYSLHILCFQYPADFCIDKCVTFTGSCCGENLWFFCMGWAKLWLLTLRRAAWVWDYPIWWMLLIKLPKPDSLSVLLPHSSRANIPLSMKGVNPEHHYSFWACCGLRL